MGHPKRALKCSPTFNENTRYLRIMYVNWKCSPQSAIPLLTGPAKAHRQPWPKGTSQRQVPFHTLSLVFRDFHCGRCALQNKSCPGALAVHARRCGAPFSDHDVALHRCMRRQTTSPCTNHTLSIALGAAAIVGPRSNPLGPYLDHSMTPWSHVPHDSTASDATVSGRHGSDAQRHASAWRTTYSRALAARTVFQKSRTLQ